MPTVSPSCSGAAGEPRGVSGRSSLSGTAKLVWTDVGVLGFFGGFEFNILFLHWCLFVIVYCRTSHPLLHTSHQRTRKTNKLTQNFSTTRCFLFFPFWQNSGAQSIALRSRAFPQGTLLSGALGVGLCRARGGILAAWVPCGALRVCCPAAFPPPCAWHHCTWGFSSSLTASLSSASFDT